MTGPRLQSFALVVVVALAACTSDKANPILPSTGNPKGWVSGGSSVDAQTSGDATATDSTADRVADASGNDGSNGRCDLLLQNCENPADGCYPTSDVGKCQTRGGVGELGPCGLGELTSLCDRGLACVSSNSMGGICVHICDVAHPQTVCGIGVACHPKWANMTVGYCEPA